MKNGCPVPTLKHTDLDFHLSFGSTGTLPTFPPQFDTDAGMFGLPDQNTDGMPEGCTNYAQAALATDLTRVKKSPLDLEAVTHANASGGYQIRDSLDAARKLGWFNWYFNIQAYAPLDSFDAIRYAQLMGVANNEYRSVTIGTPWFPSWEASILQGIRILPMPTSDELAAIRASSFAFGWHDWELTGWSQMNGAPLFKGKSWQGGRDPLYVSREVINVVMALKNTVAYTPTMLAAPTNVRISLPLFDWLSSFIRNFPKTWRY